MPEEEKKKSLLGKGASKFVAGLVMNFLTPLVGAAGFFAVKLGIGLLVLSVLPKAISMLPFSQDTKDFWTRQSQRLRSIGTKIFLGGVICSIPFVAGTALMLEGGYNAVTGDDSYGIWPALKRAARFTSGGWRQLGDPEITPTPAIAPELRPQSNKPISPDHLLAPVRSIDTVTVVNAKSFEAATQAYKAEINKSSAGKYEMTSFEKEGNGYKAVYIPPGYTKDNCPEGLKVEQILDLFRNSLLYLQIMYSSNQVESEMESLSSISVFI